MRSIRKLQIGLGRFLSLSAKLPAILLTTIFAVSIQAATYTVNSTNDPGDGVCDATCTLREAVTASNASPAVDDTIDFNLPAGSSITLMVGHLLILDSVTISGPGARDLTINGNGNSRIFQVEPILDAIFGFNATVNLSGLTLTNGNGSVTAIAGIGVTPGPGGAILNTGGGTLNLTEMNISGNTVPLFGLIPNNLLVGGGVATIGTDLLNTRTNIVRCTIANNSAVGGGGGVSNVGTQLGLLGGTTTIVNSTITSNNTGGAGGGIINTLGTLNLTNNTISHNTSVVAGGGVVNVAGLPPLGVVNMRNNIVARNNAQVVGSVLNLSDDVFGIFNSQGNNLIGHNLNATASFAASVFVGGIPQPNVNLDLVGSVSVNTSVIDPRLGSMTNNGGPTNTRALLSNSVAIDRGNNCVVTNTCASNPGGNNPPSALTTDQRSGSFTRQFDGNGDTVAVVDIGAFERQAGDPVDQVYTVDTSSDHAPDGCTTGDCTLREAILAANSNPGEDSIVFDNTLIGSTITLTNGPTTFGQLVITDSVNIVGPGGCARNITVSGGNTSRVFQVTPATLGNDIQVRISGMTITNGSGSEWTLLGIPQVPGPGGAILNTGGATLFLDDVNVSGNSISLLGVAPLNSLVGGGVATVGTDLNRSRTYISRSLISNNSAGGGGGGVANVGTGTSILGATTTITNTTITLNGAQALVDGSAGGGILNAGGTMFITNATVSHNRAFLLGGGITNVVGISPVGAVYTRNSIYANNTDLLGTNLLFPDTAGIFISLGNNLVGNNGSIGLTVGLDANVTVGGPPVGATVDIVGSIQVGFVTIDPFLGPLQDNGGCTDTRALLTGSVAIDRANNCVTDGSCPTFNPSDPIFLWDQRGPGFDRRRDGDGNTTLIVDIGAYELQQPQAPTAAEVSLSGRITDRYGRAISSVTVTVTDGGGFTKSGRTNSFGYYVVRGIPAGESYIVSPSARRYVFTPRFVSLNDNLSGFDFSPDEGVRAAPVKGPPIKSFGRLKEEYK